MVAFLSAKKLEEDHVDPVIRELMHKLGRIGQLSELELVTLRGSIDALIEERLSEEE